MKSRSLLLQLCVLGCAAVAPVLRAQQQAAPPYDPNTVLATLKDLKARQASLVGREKAGVTTAIAAARAEPLKAYEQAVTAVELQGPSGSDGAKVVEWRKRNAELLRNRDFANGLRLYLDYIGLTWQHSMGVKTHELLPALLDYTSQVSALSETLSAFEPLKKSLGESVFVAYFQIAPYLSNMQEWHDRPLDVEGIFQKTLLPEMRRTKDARLLDYWANRIQAESARPANSQSALSANRFNNIRKPTLLWERAEDELLLGQQNQAVADMLALLKAHPDHPDFEKWTARLTAIVTPPKAEVTVGTPIPTP